MAGLDKEGVAIGADFGPGGEFEITARAGKDEPESAVRTNFVLVVDGCPAAGTHDLAALRAHPIDVVHRGVAGRAAVQSCYVGWQI
jgi:hypothetical protein